MTDLREQLQASLGASYAIERELGGAGMSRVFVARESSLGRLVVVKVLPPDLSGSVSVARFRREISVAARLQHPHIVPLLAAGEVEGLPYYIMPFVEGDSLRTRLTRGELPIADVTSILRDVAKALAYAHGEGVTHRDIKPDNVLLAGTSAVITDFGVAKAISDATVGGSALTSVGVALGTPAYMAPEQAAADPSTDFRADLYAFGAMAYELLAGHLPFAGRSPQAMLAANAVEAPRPISALRPATPPLLADLVMQCLEKRPGDRPQSAGVIADALDGVPTTRVGMAPARAWGAMLPVGSVARVPARRLAFGVAALCLCAMAAYAWPHSHASGGAEKEIRSIAVLPFENKSGDSTYDYLEDGVTDHVRDALNVIPGLSVKARSSSRQLQGRDAHAIGAALEVGAVLQGSVSRSSSRLHVTAELVRTADNTALWSSTFDGQPNELQGMQDTIARAIIGRLHLAPPDARADGRSPAGARGTANLEAYDRFLQGRHAFDILNFSRALESFHEAIALDPSFALAHAYLAMAYANAPTLGLASMDSMNALANASIARALALDSSVAEAYAARSFVMTGEMRLTEAVTALEKALAIDPRNAYFRSSYGLALSQIGRVEEGREQTRRARESDPLSISAIGIDSYLLEQSGQLDAAIAAMRTALALEPNSVLIRQKNGFYFAFDGMPDSALASFEAAFKVGPTMFGGRSNLVFAYAVAGRWEDAARQRALIEREIGGNSPNYQRMVVHLAHGENDAAMTSLEKGVAAREALLGIVSIPCDPLFNPLKGNPRYVALMARLGAHACAPTVKWPITAPR